MADEVDHSDSPAAQPANDGVFPWRWIDGLRGRRLDAAVAILSALMVAGLVLDFRNHASGISFEEEGFLTPEHVFFYTAFLCIAATIVAVTYDNRRQGASWMVAVPEGYRLGVLGVFTFGFGGFGDFVWHSLFGFEVGVEALTSPTHLLLAAGAVLFVSSPLRATWYDTETVRGKRLAPAIVSATLTVLVLLLFTLFANPLNNPIPSYGPEQVETLAGGGESSTEMARALGVTSILLYSGILTGASLTLVRRFTLPPGTFTVLFGGTAAAVTVPELAFEFVPAMVVSGAFADVLYRFTRPSLDRVRSFRLFAALVPLVTFGLYYVTISLVGTVHWTVHVWVGSVVLAGATGLLLSYLVFPSARAPVVTPDDRGRGEHS